MSDEAIKSGDVVLLKSGSLKMTVQDVVTMNGKQVAVVVWADQNHAHHTANYHVSALKKA